VTNLRHAESDEYFPLGADLGTELLHLPDKPAGVEEKRRKDRLAFAG
jgi:hypothetical protein